MDLLGRGRRRAPRVDDDLGSCAGIFWDPGSPLDYPWSLSLGALCSAMRSRRDFGRLSRRALTLGGDLGRVAARRRLLSAGTPSSLNDRQWYAGLASPLVGPVSGLTTTGEIDFTAHDAAVDVGPTTRPSEFPRSARSMLSLRTSARASWRPVPRMQVQAGWTGVVHRRDNGRSHEFVEGSLRVNDESERFSTGVVRGTVGFLPGGLDAVAGLSGSFAPSDELEFTLELADLLAPLLEEGRGVSGPRVRRVPVHRTGLSSIGLQPNFTVGARMLTLIERGGNHSSSSSCSRSSRSRSSSSACSISARSAWTKVSC